MSSARSAFIGSGYHLEVALEQWRAALGRENVILDPQGLGAAETATFGSSVTVPAIVLPGNREEVQQVLRIANEWRITVCPVSGSCKPPVATGAAIARLKPGSHLGPFEIVEVIGAGGMGEVYRARDPRFPRDVAIKLMPAAFADDPSQLARFE